MKIILNDIKLILFLNKYLTSNLNFDNMEELQIYFKDLFIKLKEIYDIKLTGYYYINVYIDKNYGVILEMEKEEIEFIEYEENEIDMHIVLNECEFLYELEDIFDYYQLLKYIDIYSYKNKYYGKIKNNISNSQYMNLIEMSTINYKNASEVIKYGKKIET